MQRALSGAGGRADRRSCANRTAALARAVMPALNLNFSEGSTFVVSWRHSGSGCQWRQAAQFAGRLGVRISRARSYDGPDYGQPKQITNLRLLWRPQCRDNRRGAIAESLRYEMCLHYRH